MKEVLEEERADIQGLCEFRVDDIRILVPVVDTDPHLYLPLADSSKFPDPEIGKMDKTYLSKSAQPSQNTASNPSRIFPLRWRKDLDPHILHSQPLHFMQ